MKEKQPFKPGVTIEDKITNEILVVEGVDDGRIVKVYAKNEEDGSVKRRETFSKEELMDAVEDGYIEIL